jgi:hypothetical protein
MAKITGKGIQAGRRVTRASGGNNPLEGNLSSGAMDRAEFGASSGMGAMADQIGMGNERNAKSLDHVSNQLNGVNGTLNDLNSNMETLKKLEGASLLFEFAKFNEFGKTFDGMDDQFGGMQEMFEKMDKGFTSMGYSLDEIVARTEAGTRAIVKAVSQFHSFMAGDSTVTTLDRMNVASNEQTDAVMKHRTIRQAQREFFKEEGIETGNIVHASTEQKLAFDEVNRKKSRKMEKHAADNYERREQLDPQDINHWRHTGRRQLPPNANLHLFGGKFGGGAGGGGGGTGPAGPAAAGKGKKLGEALLENADVGVYTPNNGSDGGTYRGKKKRMTPGQIREMLEKDPDKLRRIIGDPAMDALLAGEANIMDSGIIRSSTTSSSGSKTGGAFGGITKGSEAAEDIKKLVKSNDGILKITQKANSGGLAKNERDREKASALRKLQSEEDASKRQGKVSKLKGIGGMAMLAGLGTMLGGGIMDLLGNAGDMFGNKKGTKVDGKGTSRSNASQRTGTNTDTKGKTKSSSGRMTKSNKQAAKNAASKVTITKKWNKLAKKFGSERLKAFVAKRALASGAAAIVPGIGWVLGVIGILWTAYEIYDILDEFEKEAAEEDRLIKEGNAISDTAPGADATGDTTTTTTTPQDVDRRGRPITILDAAGNPITGTSSSDMQGAVDAKNANLNNITGGAAGPTLNDNKQVIDSGNTTTIHNYGSFSQDRLDTDDISVRVPAEGWITPGI